MTKLWTIVGRFLWTLAAAYVLVCALLFLVQRKLMYPAPKKPLRPEFGELVEVSGAAAAPVFGAWIAPPDDEARVVVYFHGNAEMLAWQSSLAAGCALHGLGLLALEYPGYGLMAEQATDEESIVATAEAGIAWLRARGVPPERTVLMGRSLGTGVAVELARRGEAARLVLFSPFTSFVAMAGEAFPFVPARLLLRDRFDNIGKAPDVQAPVLLVPGARDEVIPTRMSECLAEAFPNATTRLVEGAGHNDLPVFTTLMPEIAEFCSRR